MFNPKHLKPVKEIVDWLNQEFPTHSGKKLFAAYYVKGDSLGSWHVCCEDMFVWKSEEYNVATQAVREVYPDIKIIFPFLYCVWMYVLQKRKETARGESVILIK